MLPILFYFSAPLLTCEAHSPLSSLRLQHFVHWPVHHLPPGLFLLIFGNGNSPSGRGNRRRFGERGNFNGSDIFNGVLGGGFFFSGPMS